MSWYWVSPRRYPDFAWAWLSRFLVVLGTAFLTTYQPFYLTDKLGLPQGEVPGPIFRSMLVQSSMVVALSVIGGRLSDALQRRKAFVLGGAIVYALGLWVIALADRFYDASMDTANGQLAIPIVWGTDAVHGHNNVIGATLFPHNIGLGAAHNPDLMERIATVTAREVAVTGLDWIEPDWAAMYQKILLCYDGTIKAAARCDRVPTSRWR